MESKKYALVFCLLLGGCFFIGTDGTSRVVQQFETLRDRYFVRHLLYNPVTATYLGADGYSDVLQSTNGALKDYSAQALSREVAFYLETHQELQGVPFDALSPPLKVDYRVMDAQLRFLIRLIRDRKYYQRAIDTYVAEPFRGVDWQMQQMQDAGNGRRGTEHEWEQLVERVAAIPGYLDNARTNLLAGHKTGNLPDWRMVQRNGISASLASVDYFRRTLPETATADIGDRPFGQALLPRLTQAGDKAGAAWQGFAEFLRSTYDETDRTDRLPPAPKTMNGECAMSLAMIAVQQSSMSTVASRLITIRS